METSEDDRFAVVERVPCAWCHLPANVYKRKRFVTRDGKQLCSRCFMDYAVDISGGRA